MMRKRSRDEKAQSFLEERGRHLHPALDATHSSLQEHYSARESLPYVFKDSTYAQTVEFIKSVEAYQDVSQDPRIRALKIKDKSSWDEVMRAAQETEEKYLLAGSNGVRKYSRKAADKAAIFLPYVRMIPNDMFFSVLSGGLRLIFEESAENNVYESSLTSHRPLPKSASEGKTF